MFWSRWRRDRRSEDVAAANCRQELPRPWEAEFAALARPSVRLVASVVDDAAIPVGACKLGGDPDLPVGFEWPKWDGVPLAFR